ncbi:MAG TPA: SH3 domain-containing protein [Blastocatellia bacterium]|nr:SH3 domain-containing protein [Blastocatellia bacterium]
MPFQLRSAVILALLFLTGSPQLVRAQVAKLRPVDEAARDPSFFVFRARLLEALQQRDTAFLLSVLSPGIRVSFGAGGGIADFQKMWKPERPDSKIWLTLTEILALGGSFREGNTFAAPYIYSNFPDQFDAFEYGVIVGEDVRVRQRPDLNSPVIGTLSYDIVKVAEWQPKQAAGSKQNWVAVMLANGAQGYVAEDYIRSPIGYRAIFEKKDGRWLLAALVAGD